MARAKVTITVWSVPTLDSASVTGYRHSKKCGKQRRAVLVASYCGGGDGRRRKTKQIDLPPPPTSVFDGVILGSVTKLRDRLLSLPPHLAADLAACLPLDDDDDHVEHLRRGRQVVYKELTGRKWRAAVVWKAYRDVGHLGQNTLHHKRERPVACQSSLGAGEGATQSALWRRGQDA